MAKWRWVPSIVLEVCKSSIVGNRPADDFLLHGLRSVCGKYPAGAQVAQNNLIVVRFW
jgi:hypothetical protein